MPVVEAMQEYVDAGLTTFDMADIYGPAEEIFGQFNSQVSVYIYWIQYYLHIAKSPQQLPQATLYCKVKALKY